MPTQTITIIGDSQRDFAKSLIDNAPVKSTVKINDAPTRTQIQNDKMWAMLNDISKAKPEGREYTPDLWKAVFMNACGYQVQFINGLDGEPFPVGFSSSKMNVQQMADLITFIYQYGDLHNVDWSEPSTGE